MYPDACGQIVNQLNITSVDAPNLQQVKDAAENNALGEKDKKLPILDIRPGWLKPGVVDVDGDIQGNGMPKASILKVPQNYSLLQTRLRDLLSLRVGLVSQVERQEVQFIIHQILTRAVQEAHIVE